MVKKRSQTGAAHHATPEQAEALANELADKPYGQKKEVKLAKKAEPAAEKAQAIGISLPPAMIEKLQDEAIANKRGGAGQKTVSGLIRELLEKNGY